MKHQPASFPLSRRSMIQVGAAGLLGLPAGAAESAKGGSVIYIFFSGGLAQHETFDPKPDAAEGIRGEFASIQTSIPGVTFSEHLPELAKRADQLTVIRSLTHPSNDHSLGHHIMLTGRSDAPPTFNPNRPQATDHPSIPSIAGLHVAGPAGLPGSIVLPDKLVHRTGRVIPGQFGGQLGSARDPWFVKSAVTCPGGYGSCPHCFSHLEDPHKHKTYPIFAPPKLSLPEEIGDERFRQRLAVLDGIDRQRADLERQATSAMLDRQRASAISLLCSADTRDAFDVQKEDPRVLERYGRHLFGWSLLLARRLVEVGVPMVQVNLGNNETWDTHGNIFPHLKEKLLPPMDQAVSALLDDLQQRGLWDRTLVIGASEFGRTPKISQLSVYKRPGRDHWGSVQSAFAAGGGVANGRVIGSSDRNGGYPASQPITPEQIASTMYHALGIPADAHYHDAVGRPNAIYRDSPIQML